MRLKLGEHPRAPACAIAQDARHRERGVVIENRQRHAVEEGECRIVTVAERLGRLRRIGLDEARIAVRQIQGKEVNLPGDPADHRPGFTEVHLGMARRVIEGNEHLAAAQPLAADIVLDDGVAALEAVLIAKTLEDPLRRVTLLAMTMPVLFQYPVDDRDERIQLRTPRRRATAIARRNRKLQHFANRLAVQPKHP